MATKFGYRANQHAVALLVEGIFNHVRAALTGLGSYSWPGLTSRQLLMLGVWLAPGFRQRLNERKVPGGDDRVDLADFASDQELYLTIIFGNDVLADWTGPDRDSARVAIIMLLDALRREINSDPRAEHVVNERLFRHVGQWLVDFELNRQYVDSDVLDLYKPGTYVAIGAKHITWAFQIILDAK